MCVDLCSVLNYLNADKEDLVINRKLHRKRQAGVEAIKSSEKISCSFGAGHPDQGIINIPLVHICYSPAGRSELGKTGPEVLDTARGRKSRAVLKTEGTVIPNTDRPRRVNNIFIFFYSTTKGVRTTRTFSGCNHGKIRDKLNNFW